MRKTKIPAGFEVRPQKYTWVGYGVIFGRIFFFISVLVLFCGGASAQTPSADFTCTPAGLAISCTDQSTGSPTGWAWFFGDESYSGAWKEVNAQTPWTPRIAQTVVVKRDGTIVAIGGSYNHTRTDGTSFVDMRQDVYLSKDKGVTWTPVSTTGLGYRLKPSGVLASDGSIVLMGGYGSDDVVRSVDNGATWTLVNANPGWFGRHDFSSVVLPDGRIVMMGGQNNTDGINLRDVWSSPDTGSAWTEVNANPAWLPRSMQSGVVTPDGNIVMTGGYNQTEGINNQTWLSKDGGATWILMNPSSGWETRRYHTSVAMPDGSIVLMGGSNIQINPPYQDVWRSTDDGATWTIVNAHPGWSARDSQASAVLPDGSIVLIGGAHSGTEYMADVWQYNPSASSDQNPSHSYTAPGTYQVTLQAYNADGFTSVRKYVTVPASGQGDYYINVVPVSDKRVGDKFTINATTNLNAGEKVLVEVYAPYTDRNHKSPSGEFSGASGTMTVQAGANNVNYFTFDIDSSTFKPDIYLINDTAMNIPGLGRSYFYVLEGSAPVTMTSTQLVPPSKIIPTTFPVALNPFIALCGFAGAFGIIRYRAKKRYDT